MRLAGTAAVCAALAFGAAFLVGRAIGHDGHSTALKLSSATVGRQASSDPQLASEFTPSFTALRLRRHVKIHHLAKAHHAATTHTPSSTSSTVTPSTTGTTHAYTAPVSTPPATTHHSSSSGQGSGTTSVGGSSSSKKKGSGTGTTSVGG